MSIQPGATLYTQGFGSKPENVEVPHIDTRAPTSSDVGPFFPVGKRWIFLGAGEYVLLSNTTSGGVTTANWSLLGTSGSPLNTLTGSTGGAISPVSSNINILGNSLGSFAGTAGTLTYTPTASAYPISPYVVGQAGKSGYQTIQSALDAANLAGGGTVYVQPGSYSENLTLYDNTEITGAVAYENAGNIVLTGVHTPPTTGNFSFSNLQLASPTHIFSSVAAGSASLAILGCTFNLTNGFIFNLVNWTGAFNINDCGELSTNNGVVNNAGAATFFSNNCQIGAGTVNTFTSNGSCRFDLTFLNCPCNITGGQIFTNFALFGYTLTIGGNATGTIFLGDFFPASGPAITMSSSASISIFQTTINTANNPVISGSGAGTLTLGDMVFLSGSNISGTLTVVWAPTKTGNVSAVGSVTATTGPITATNGNLVLGTAGNKILVATGANASIGTSGALTGGTITISTSAVTTNSKFFFTTKTLGTVTVAQTFRSANIVNGVSFDIVSSAPTDTSTVDWFFIN